MTSSIIWSVLATALFYATPVLYPVSVVSSSIRDVIALNPLTPIFDLAQRWVTEPSTPWPAATALGGPVRLAIALALYVRGVRVRGLDLPSRGATDRRGALKRPRLVARGRQDRAREHDRDQRDRRHLPVPVERRVRQVGRRAPPIAAAGASGGAQRARAPRARPRRRTRQQQRQPDDPELGERLQLAASGRPARSR